MRVTFHLAVSSLALSLLLLNATPAFACDCHDGGPVCQVFWEAPVIFAGRVETVTLFPGRNESQRIQTKFRVLEQFRGAPAREIELITTNTSCDLFFNVGDEWLIYAFPRPNGVGLTTGTCSRSRPLQHARDDLAYARSIYSARSDKGRIFGRLAYVREHNIVAVPGITITVSGTGWAPISSVTDAQGRFEVLAVPGNYSITAATPRGMTVRYDPIVNLADSRGCVEAELWADYTGEVTGQIVNHLGRPVPHLTLEVIKIDGFDSAFSRPRAITDTSGRFALAGLSVGRYRLGIVSGVDRDGPRFHYLGDAVDAAGRRHFAIDGGKATTLGSLTLPNAVRIAQINGVVVNNEDQLQPGIKIRIKADVDGGDYPWTTIATDKRGRFTFALATGISYRIVAEPWEAAASASSRRVTAKLDPSAPGRTLRLVLP